MAKKQNQNLPGMGGVFNTVNLNLYHYAGNNPIKYVDPSGKTAKNASSQYVVVRLESDKDVSHYMILAPGDFISADCDGFIFESSNIGKVSAEEDWGDVVNFTIYGDSALGVFFFFDDIKSFWINTSRDEMKDIANFFVPTKNLINKITGKDKKSLYNLSGSYKNQKEDGAPLNGWWNDVVEEFGFSQKEWKEKYETNSAQKELQQKYLQKDQKE